ncbi:hypothetical protein GJAV_G00220880 [Gymnothorax javanicus]|nr:hypothetical protein GJAV_G00220880 [Gymnothorax javanicus]
MHTYRVLQCTDEELTQVVATMSDGWKLVQSSPAVPCLELIRTAHDDNRPFKRRSCWNSGKRETLPQRHDFHLPLSQQRIFENCQSKYRTRAHECGCSGTI